jgi:protein involved in temperature-dependent protein secretion
LVQQLNNNVFLKAKNVKDYVSSTRVIIVNENTIADGINDAKFNVLITTDVGKEVLFNFKLFTILGIIVNNYAQSETQTPLLFDYENLVNDYKALIQSKFSDEEIINKEESVGYLFSPVKWCIFARQLKIL